MLDELVMAFVDLLQHGSALLGGTIQDGLSFLIDAPRVSSWQSPHGSPLANLHGSGLDEVAARYYCRLPHDVQLIAMLRRVPRRDLKAGNNNGAVESSL